MRYFKIITIKKLTFIEHLSSAALSHNIPMKLELLLSLFTDGAPEAFRSQVSYQNLKTESDREKFESKYPDTRVCIAPKQCAISEKDKSLEI